LTLISTIFTFHNLTYFNVILTPGFTDAAAWLRRGNVLRHGPGHMGLRTWARRAGPRPSSYAAGRDWQTACGRADLGQPGTPGRRRPGLGTCRRRARRGRRRLRGRLRARGASDRRRVTGVFKFAAGLSPCGGGRCGRARAAARPGPRAGPGRPAATAARGRTRVARPGGGGPVAPGIAETAGRRGAAGAGRDLDTGLVGLRLTGAL
jgi:hypothetical protein